MQEAIRIIITGAQGAGKSTLADALQDWLEQSHPQVHVERQCSEGWAGKLTLGAESRGVAAGTVKGPVVIVTTTVPGAWTAQVVEAAYAVRPEQLEAERSRLVVSPNDLVE